MPVAGRVTGMLAAAAPPGHQSSRRCPATRVCADTRTDACEKVVAQGSRAPAGLGAAAPCQVPGAEAAAVAAGNQVGITGTRQCALPLVCSPVRGVHRRKHGNGLVAGGWMLSWGSSWLLSSTPSQPTVLEAHAAALPPGGAGPMPDFGSGMGAARLGQTGSDAVIVTLRRSLTWADAGTLPV